MTIRVPPPTLCLRCLDADWRKCTKCTTLAPYFLRVVRISGSGCFRLVVFVSTDVQRPAINGYPCKSFFLIWAAVEMSIRLPGRLSRCRSGFLFLLFLRKPFFPTLPEALFSGFPCGRGEIIACVQIRCTMFSARCANFRLWLFSLARTSKCVLRVNLQILFSQPGDSRCRSGFLLLLVVYPTALFSYFARGPIFRLSLRARRDATSSFAPPLPHIFCAVCEFPVLVVFVGADVQVRATS
jgi:hypothetical protein